MKRISVIAIAAIAALALTAAVGAASASATVLCKTGKLSGACPIGESYGVGTETSASLVPGTNLVIRLANGQEWSNCSAATLKSKVTDAGGPGKVVKTQDLSGSFGSCARPTKFVQYGSGEVKYTDPGNGELVNSGTRFEINTSGFSCIYKFPTSTKVTGGSPSKLELNEAPLTLAVNGGGCPEVLKITAKYNISSPASLFVEDQESPSTVLCKANEGTCASGNIYSAGTNVKAGLKASTSFSLTNSQGESISSCKASSLTGQVVDPGGVGKEAAVVDVSATSFGSCSVPLEALGLPWHAEIKRSGATGSGTATVTNLSVKATTPFYGVCIYGGSPTFTLKGGTEAEIAAAGVSLAKQPGSTFVCPSTVTLNASYLLSEPAPLFVSSP